MRITAGARGRLTGLHAKWTKVCVINLRYLQAFSVPSLVPAQMKRTWFVSSLLARYNADFWRFWAAEAPAHAELTQGFCRGTLWVWRLIVPSARLPRRASSRQISASSLGEIPKLRSCEESAWRTASASTWRASSKVIASRTDAAPSPCRAPFCSVASCKPESLASMRASSSLASWQSMTKPSTSCSRK